MKTPRIIAALLLTTLTLAGCSEPVWWFSGGKLSGKDEALQFAKIPAEGGVIQLETNPDDPYSVNVNCTIIDGTVYVDPQESRAWYQNIKQSPRVRFRFDGSDLIHDALAVEETDQEIIGRFDSDRIVLKMLPAP